MYLRASVMRGTYSSGDNFFLSDFSAIFRSRLFSLFVRIVGESFSFSPEDYPSVLCFSHLSISFPTQENRPRCRRRFAVTLSFFLFRRGLFCEGNLQYATFRRIIMYRHAICREDVPCPLKMFIGTFLDIVSCFH